jgi:hypothetical protein
MKACMPNEKYQHFYEGLPSTNGLSGKWISEVAIFNGEAPVKPGEKLTTEPTAEDSSGLPIIPIVIGVAGAIVVASSAIIMFRKKRS